VTRLSSRLTRTSSSRPRPPARHGKGVGAGLERSVPIGTLTLVKEAATEYGFDAYEVFRSIGISAEDFRDPLTPVPIRVAGQAMSRAVIKSGCPHFAALVGARARLENAGLVPLLVLGEACVRDAIVDLSRFLRIWYRGVHFVLHVERGCARFSVSIEGSFEGHTELCTSYTSSMNRHLGRIIGAAWRPSRIYLGRRESGNGQAYNKIFHAPVVFDAAQYAIEFPESVLAGRREMVNDRFNFLLREQLVALERLKNPSIVDQVHRLIEILLTRGECNVERVAALLSIHRQTLYRHLRDHGTSFEEELDAVRRQIAERMLSGGGLSIAQVAQALGYTEPVSFTRAFNRWHGIPPTTWRRRKTF